MPKIEHEPDDVIDHGSIGGLTDDDHNTGASAYLTTSRHDSDDHSGLTVLSYLTALGLVAKAITYTGNGSDNRTVAHGLGRAPILVLISRDTVSESLIIWIGGMPAGDSKTFLGVTRTDSIKGVDGTNITLGAYSGVNSSGATYTMFVI